MYKIDIIHAEINFKAPSLFDIEIYKKSKKSQGRVIVEEIYRKELNIPKKGVKI